MAQFSQSNGCGQQRSVAVIGGGLVGSLAACFLGRRGYEVHLYEYRSDIRRTELVQGRSINLALSARGRAALREIGLESALVEGYGIPLAARMIHAVSGATKSIPYDVTTHQAIYSVGRKHLNEVLLTGTEKYPNIHLHFNHKLVNADLNNGTVTILDVHESRSFSKTFDLVVGADGAFSAVRKFMMKEPLFGYSQTYIEHGYMELCIPPTEQGQFAMPHNYLHIWPRGQFMMIALPNQDFSWTVTLFMPFVKFGTLDSKDHLVEFFQCYFPDSIPLIGEDKLVEDFFKAKPLPLVSIKCSSYHVSDKVLIMGDAAHAMVPFYGQGMNAGFEDCLLFDTLLDQHFGDIAISLKDFSEKRKNDAHAICDLAMYNYVEMRELVNKRSFLLRKWLDDFLFWIFPRIWVPLYNSVTFTDMGYQQCVRNRQWQDMIITRFLYATSALGIAALALAFRHLPFHDVITYFRQRLDSLFLWFS